MFYKSPAKERLCVCPAGCVNSVFTLQPISPHRLPPSETHSALRISDLLPAKESKCLRSQKSLLNVLQFSSFESQSLIRKEDSVTIISYTCWEIYMGRLPSTDRLCGIYVCLEKYLDFCHGFAICIRWQLYSSGKDLCWQCKLGHSDIGPLGMLENLQNCWRMTTSCNLDEIHHHMELYFQIMTVSWSLEPARSHMAWSCIY